MNETTFVINPDRCQKIFHQMSDMLLGEVSLMECLTAMQTGQGIDEKDAKDNAHRCMLAVAAHETLREALSENSMAVLEKLFARLKKESPGQQMEALHQIFFGLTLYEDPDRVQSLENGVSLNDLYQTYRSEAAPALTAEALEDQIRFALQQYHITPGMMRTLTKQMRGKAGYFAAAEALGERGRNLKCLVAMDLWLQNPDAMTLEEAAGTAATSVETQAVADALNRGYIARDVALTILTVLGHAIAVYGTFLFVAYVPESLMTAQDIWSLGGTLAEAEARLAFVRKSALGGLLIETAGLALNEFSGELAAFLGATTAKVSAMLRKADENATGLEELVESAEDTAEMGYVDINPKFFVHVDQPEEGLVDEDPDFVFF